MQDAYLNNNYNLYQVINPLDINRNYQQQQQQQQQQSHQVFISNQQNVLRLPTKKINNYVPQVVKRGKFSHNNNSNSNSDASGCENTSSSSSSSITSSINSTINSLIKQESCLSFNSDGESSMVSSENDSNSNCSSLNNEDFTTTLTTFNNQNQNQQLVQQNQLQQQSHSTKLTHININSINSKKVIIATKLEPFCNLNQTFQLQSNCNASSNQINLIKIANGGGDGTVSGLSESKSFLGNKKTDNNLNQNNKKIIQYKQLVNSNGNLIKTTQLNKHKQLNNSSGSVNGSNANIINSDGVITNHNGVPLATRPDGKVYPKPPYSYSCLIAMTLRNSDSGTLPVSDIYDFIM